jgi:subtilisin family serine protease
MKVAVLDSGFRGYRDFLGKGLPEKVTVRSFRVDGNLEARDSQHGILCGEVVHALAPAAELLFANWEPDHPEQFLEAVRWARGQGARVISCSVIMPTWSDGEGGGAVHQKLAEVLGKGQAERDLLCFASAGNTAQRHWSGQFRPDLGKWHQWEQDQTDNEVTPWGKERVSVELYWRPGPEYGLAVVDETTGKEAGQAIVSCGTDRCDVVVRFDPQAGHHYQARVRGGKDATGPFHLVVLGGGLKHTRASGSVCFPADGASIVAVGAVDDRGRRMSYSAFGPNSAHPKPDLLAPVPFPSSCRSLPFGGTSAAAPQAAALAAVLWSRHPDWPAERVRASLQPSTRGPGPVGRDPETRPIPFLPPP